MPFDGMPEQIPSLVGDELDPIWFSKNPQVITDENGVRHQSARKFDAGDKDYLLYAPSAMLDADTNYFFSEELVHLIPGMLETDFGRINARNIFPVYFANDPGAQSVKWRQISEYGEAEIATDYASEAPLAEVEGAEKESAVRMIRSAAQWTIDELNAAQKAGRSIDASKATGARNALLRKENKIAFNGDTDYNLEGLFTNTDIPRDTAAQTFAVGNVDENLTELFDLTDAIPSNTEEVEEPDTILMAPGPFRRIARQRLGVDSTMTTLKFFQGNSDTVRTIIKVRELKGAGTGGTDVAVAFRRDPTKLRLIVGVDLVQRPPVTKEEAIRVTYLMKVGGLVIHKPMSLRILEGI